MADEKNDVAASDLTRWMVLFALIVVGIVLFFWLGPSTEPIVRLVRPEAPQ
jgi:hypothetical protein